MLRAEQTWQLAHGVELWAASVLRRDLAPAERLGGRGILVRAGAEHGEAERAPDHVDVVDGLPEAVERVLAASRAN